MKCPKCGKEDIDNFAITIDISEAKKMIRELKRKG